MRHVMIMPKFHSDIQAGSRNIYDNLFVGYDESADEM